MDQGSKMNGLECGSEGSCDLENAAADCHSGLRNGLYDHGNQLSNGTGSSSSGMSYGGSRPKTRDTEENIPNGVQKRHQASQSEPQWAHDETQSIGLSGNRNNLSSETPRQKRDFECQAGPSQAPLNWSGDGESDASRLAAVCAASSRRAMAERARKAEPGVMKRLRSPVNSGSSSDTEKDDGLSGDECCIYTYKGDQNADLSNGLLGLSLPHTNDHSAVHPPNAADNVNRPGGSSPEMDFLEMDFDPDLLGEQDSVEEDNVQVNLLERPVSVSPSLSAEEVSNEHSAPALSPEHSSSEEEGGGALLESSDSSDSSDSEDEEEMPDMGADPYANINVGASTSASTSADSIKNIVLPKVPPHVSKEILRGQHIAGSQLCPVDMEDIQKLSLVSGLSSWQNNSEPVLDKQKFNLYSALYHSIMANNLILDEEEDENARKMEEGGDDGNVSVEDGARGGKGYPEKMMHQRCSRNLSDFEKTMIWTEREACHKQVSQIAVSACGAAAVSNVLSALNIPYCLEQVHEGVATRLRAEKASIPTYLFSRSAAGSAHNDLIRGLEIASDGAVFSRFFHMYPERSFSLSRWLAHWIKEGAVPIATLNIQRSINQGSTIPDSWHHQMIFGVSHRGIYLTNPLECVSEEALLPQLCSPSELLVRRQDVVSRWSPNTDLHRLATSSDIRWKQMNVLGQVVNVLREANTRPSHNILRRNLTPYVSIPASYCSGILLSVVRDTSAAVRLQNAPELPFRVF